MKYELNTIKVALENYKHLLRGQIKLGKTTLYRDIILTAYGRPEYGLLISPSNETGFRAIDNLYGIEAPTWEDFVEIIDDLVENKANNSFKIICIDTVDALVEIAIDKVMKIHFQRKGEKAVSLNAALGGYSAGHAMVGELINDQIRRLEKAQYGIFLIGHTKLKQITDPETGNTYDQVVGNLESRFDTIFTNKADIVCTLALSKEIVDGKLVGTNRSLYFRASSFIDAGSRLKGVPEKTEYGAKEYIKAFEQGVKASFTNRISDEEIQAMKEKEAVEKEKKTAEYIEKEKNVILDDEKLETIEDYRNCIEKKLEELDSETKKQKRVEIKESGLSADYKKYESIDDLKKFLKIIISK
ncbi:MAG: AAA family ATPase [Clostridiales bacterium]